MAQKSIIAGLKFKKPQSEFFDYVQFGKEIEDSILSTRKMGAFTTKKTFSPSSVGPTYNGSCARYWYIAFSGAEFNDTFSAQSIANMDNGTATHARLDKVLRGTGRLVDSEVEITSEDPPIRGFIDAVLDWNGEEVIGEVKSANSNNFNLRSTKMEPSDNHLLQLLIYMKLRKAKHGVFIYENKDTQELLLIPVHVNQRYIDIIDGLFDWMRIVRKAYDDKTIPNRPYTKSKPACKGCPVFDECWNKIENKGDVQIPEYVISA